MPFTWVESIAQASKINNSNMAEIINNISFLETNMSIPEGSREVFPVGEKPFTQTGEKILAAQIGRMKSATDKIKNYQESSGTPLFCTTVNATYYIGHNVTVLSANHATNRTSNHGSHFGTHRGFYSGHNSGNQGHNSSNDAADRLYS